MPWPSTLPGSIRSGRASSGPEPADECPRCAGVPAARIAAPSSPRHPELADRGRDAIIEAWQNGTNEASQISAIVPERQWFRTRHGKVIIEAYNTVRISSLE